ncbi:biofilm regulation protein phosphatase SiaA [Halomonas pacifica]|uniref:biofilm regulation protein phosphatase SiaA n=1 Tax=Bisbaumannia pacifica TaxID=77098 RepID=UPI0023598C3D|nr:biofilm regulation protein phosphatase SiaA [Halomonas pacifica]MDC8802459.1 biofilm regulation protein phosphatase SiaA [Halomonas pacifica]
MAALLGLRGKSVVTLLFACLLALLPAALIGWKAVDEVRRHFASAYAEQYTLLQMQRIMAPLSRELALSRRFADSIVTREWLRDPTDPERRQRFFREAEGYRQQFTSGAFFIVDHASGDYYFSDGDASNGQRPLARPTYRLSPQREEDAWYFATMDSSATYNINVNVDRALERAMIWLNIKIMDDGEPLGLAGGSIDLSDFLDRFIRSAPAGLTPMIIDSRGALQAHADPERIALSSVNLSQALNGDLGLYAMLDGATQREALRAAIQQATRRPGEIATLETTLEGEPRLLTLGYIPELRWLMVTTLDLGAYPLLDSRWFWPMVLALGLILAILMGAFAYATHRLILRPLRRLTLSAQAIAGGDYSPRLPTGRDDEIGALSQAFSRMANQVERYTRDLEGQVRERTRALETAHAEMAAAHQQLGDSIQYASIIQRAILPDNQLERHLAHHYGVLWKPRDTVGGDFYVFRASGRGYLLGVVDCAGHGVPGAMMTMLARALIDQAIARHSADDPAALLTEIDRRGRELLPAERLPSSIATNMDLGLVWVDPHRERLTYAGAKIDLYASDGETLTRLKANKRAIGHRRPGHYSNQHLPLAAGHSYYLCSDGFLDQAGGSHGFGFGNPRFEALIKAQAGRPLGEQMQAFEAALSAYRGELPQRDDITLLAFRAEPTAGPATHSPTEPPTGSR